MKFPERFTTIDKLNYLERCILIHSTIYYDWDESLISDTKYDRTARLLARKAEQYKNTLLPKTTYGYVFKNYTGSTGFYLVQKLKKEDREYIQTIAYNVLKLKEKKNEHM